MLAFVHRPLRRARGMTLMELMVSVAILAGMVLAFNLILSSSQQVVSTTQRDIRANSAAMAISHVLRRDLRGISKDGWLYIGTQSINGESVPVLAFTTAGASESVTGDAHGSGSVICYRLCDNKSTASIGNDTFCRAGLVLSSEASTSATWPGGDRYAADLRDIQAYDSTNITSFVSGTLCAALSGNAAVYLPPANATQVRALWKVLTHNISELKIFYGERSGSGSIIWKDVASNSHAPWTFRNQDDWPVAVRIQFRLRAGSVQAFEKEALEGSDKYEIVAPIGR